MDQNENLMVLQNIEGAIESILFAAGYPVKYDKLSEALGLPLRDVKNMVKHMQGGYAERGIQLLLFPDSCQLCTKEEFLPYIREALGIRKGGNLSASSMEVIAIVAYNQPVTRAYIDEVRGVDSSYAVNSLLDKELIEPTGRLEAPGRPMLYGTTDKFLRVFGLNSLSDLPETEALSVSARSIDGQAVLPGVQQTIEPDAIANSTDETPLTDELQPSAPEITESESKVHSSIEEETE